MEIIIAILLAMILVAMVSSNSDAAKGVGRLIRISLIVTIIGVIWATLIGYSLWNYFNYTEQNWYDSLGLVCINVLPIVLFLFNRSSFLDFFKKDNKTVFKRLLLILGGLVIYLIALVTIQELKKENAAITTYLWLLGIGFCGLYINYQAEKYQLTLKQALTFQEYPEQVAEEEFYEWELKHNNEWFDLCENGFYDLSLEEQKAIEEKRQVAWESAVQRKIQLAEKLKSRPKFGYYILGFFWLCVVFLSIEIIGFTWGILFDLVVQLDFVKGRAWMAHGLLVLGILGLIGLIGQIIEDRKNK